MACPKTGARRRRSQRPAAQRRTAEGRCFASRGMGRETQGENSARPPLRLRWPRRSRPRSSKPIERPCGRGSGHEPANGDGGDATPVEGSATCVVAVGRNVGVREGPHPCLPPPMTVSAAEVGSSGGPRGPASVQRDAPWVRAHSYFKRLAQHLRPARMDHPKLSVDRTLVVEHACVPCPRNRPGTASNRTGDRPRSQARGSAR